MLMARRMLRLRYATKCAVCFRALSPGTRAEWNNVRKVAICESCMARRPSSARRTGVAGRSAIAEGERRRIRQQERLRRERERQPILGRLRQLVAPERDRGQSWAKGGAGEAWLGERFDADAAGGLTIPLHDRLRPGSRANIDHLVVGPNGVWVVDAKDYRGTVRKQDKGGFLRADLRLTVAGRDRTNLAAGVAAQVAGVRAALQAGPRPDVPVRGALCFVGGDFGLRLRPFSIDGVLVTWPKSIRRLVQADGPLDADARAGVAQHLDDWFKPAT